MPLPQGFPNPWASQRFLRDITQSATMDRVPDSESEDPGCELWHPLAARNSLQLLSPLVQTWDERPRHNYSGMLGDAQNMGVGLEAANM